jgi:hypothetical protein
LLALLLALIEGARFVELVLSVVMSSATARLAVRQMAARLKNLLLSCFFG